MKVFSIIEALEQLSPFVPTVDTSNYTSWVENKGESEKSTGSVSFYILLIIMLICVAINSRITFVVLVNAKPAIRSIVKLLAQFSTISICYSILIFFEFIGKTKVQIITTGGTQLCRAFSYFRHLIYGIFPLNAAALVYERYTGPSIPFGKLVEYKFMAGIWMVSALVNIPEIFQIEYSIIPKTTFGQCTQITILDSVEVSVAYESIQFLVFHGFVCLYMAVCIYKIRFKLGIILNFEMIRRVRMQRKLLRLLYVLLNTWLFGLLWLPAGVTTLVNQIQGYLDEIATEKDRTLLAFTTFLQYILLCVSPTMYMLMHPDLPPIFPGCQLYQGNIIAERRRDWRRVASRVQGNRRESSQDIKMDMLGMERGDMGMDEDEEIGRPVEMREMREVHDNEEQRPRPLISPVCSIDEMEDYALVVRVKENPQTTLVLN